MGRRRGFLPPKQCQHCGKSPELGQTLWPGERWRCSACLEDDLPGKDAVSKSMLQTIEYAQGMRTSFELEKNGQQSEAPRNLAEWARMMAAEIKKQGAVRAAKMSRSNGEVVPPTAEQGWPDTVAGSDLVAVEASLDRSRLLVQGGTDVAAMALDAANSIEAHDSLERMLAHQLAALHKQAMEQLGRVAYERSAGGQVKLVNAAARCMTVYQEGMLALHKIRNKGQQRIQVQYVQVSQGSQAVIGNIAQHSDGHARYPSDNLGTAAGQPSWE